MEIKAEPDSPSKHHNGSSESKNDELKNGFPEKKHKDKHKHKDKKHKHHKHDKDKDREKDRHRDKKERDKSHRSSSNHSEKHHKSDKHDRERSEKTESRSPEKSKPKNDVSSSPPKDSSSSSSKNKSKHKDKHHEKEKSKSSSSSNSSRPHERDVIKSEPVSPIKSFPSSAIESDDDDVPLGYKMKQNNSVHEVKKEIKKEESDSDDDVPLNRHNTDSDSTDTSIGAESEFEDFKLSGRDSKNVSKSARKKPAVEIKKRKAESDSDEDIPLSRRKKVKTEPAPKKRKRDSSDDDYEDSDYDRKKKAKAKSQKNIKSTPTKNKSSSQSPTKSPTKRGKKGKEEEEEVWKWWEEAPREDGVKWKFLEHKGPVFAPGYERLPKSVVFRYDGKPMKLSEEAEEVAGFYSRFIEHEYTAKEKFNTNFFKDWRKQMTKQEREEITDLKKCDFREINEYYKMKSEERKAFTKEQKLVLKEENEEMMKEYGVCVLDGHKEKIGNFKIEPPGLFRGRGDHPKMGMLKKRVVPEDVIINCSKDATPPPAPKGHKWKEVRHDNSVTWLACWVENVQGQTKYVMLNPTSRLKGEKDWLKYEKARELAKHIDKIRDAYKNEFKSKEMRVRQRAVAMYFIDKLALRAGNEKDEDQADTVGCCSLRHEHIQLHDKKDGKENVVVFDFLGKDSIRYYNEVPVDKKVYKNLKIFMENKKSGDDLFDRLNTAILNKHLSELMNGLTAKVFRTYNASHTLQQQLDELTPSKGTVAEKVLAYNRANRAVAILCNHQRAVPKTHEKSMENLDIKIQTKRDEVKKVKRELKDMRKGTNDHEKKKNALARLEDQLKRLEMNKTDKEEGKEIALGTSKLNYLDPRITVSWCKKWDVPVEKVYNKTQRAKFRWAIDMADKKYRFD